MGANQLSPDYRAIPADVIRAQVERILKSPTFAAAPRMQRLLAHLVDHSLEAQDHELKEYALGVEVFDRGPEFDPRTDTIVRVQAGRLRRRLKAYYDGPGKDDPVAFEIPPGHYRVTFRPSDRPGDVGSIAERDRHDPSDVRERAPALDGSIVVLLLSVLFAVVAVWLWQRSPVESAPREGASSVEAPLTAIAVLPFDDLSPDANHGWLGEGLADDLIEALSRIEGLHVTARRSTTILKSQGADLATIGERLQVGSVVEGSVRSDGEQLSVIARWVRIDGGGYLWSKTFSDRRIDDVFAIQKEISIGVAEAIRTELGIQDAPASLSEYRYTTSDIRAWELFKKAVPLAGTFEPAKVAQAREMLQQALDYDPQYREAQSSLAFVDYLADPERGVEALKTVLSEDPSEPGSLGALAWDSAMRFWDYETAEALLNRIPEHRKSAGVWEIAYHIYNNTARVDEALRAAESAVRLDPMFARAHCWVGEAHDRIGDPPELAIPHYEQAMAIVQETGQFGAWCEWGLAAAYHRLGRESEVVPAILSSGQFADYGDAIRLGWASGGWKGLNRAYAEANLAVNGRRDAMALGRDVWSCHYFTLAAAGATDRLYDCLEQELDLTAPDQAVRSYGQTLQRHLLAQFLARDPPPAHRDDPRLRAIKKRLDERIQRAAGTYMDRVGLRLPQ